jgi:hypothetical protein
MNQILHYFPFTATINPKLKSKKDTYFINSFDLLTPDSDYDDNTMEIEDHMAPNQQNTTTVASWTMDAEILELLEDIFLHLNQKKHLDEESGGIESLPMNNKKPETTCESTTKINQCMRFNVIHHRGTSADIPILKLFKSFTSTLKKADPSVIILPFSVTKQHYSSISAIKQINSMDDNKINILKLTTNINCTH